MTGIEQEHLGQLQSDGFVRIEQFFERGVIDRCRHELEQAVRGGISSPHILTSASSIHVHNFFLYGPTLRALMFGEQLQQVHRQAFGTSYCLRNAVASTIQANSEFADNKLHRPIGLGWHRDTPQYVDRARQSRVLGSGFTYQVIVAIDGSNRANSTKVLPGSHTAPIAGHRLDTSDAERVLRQTGPKDLVMQPGDIAILDDNTFHTAGVETPESRWMLFISYTPWYVKPYFDFSALTLENMTPYEEHCLHKTSTPPPPLEPIRNTFRMNQWGDQA